MTASGTGDLISGSAGPGTKSASVGGTWAATRLAAIARLHPVVTGNDLKVKRSTAYADCFPRLKASACTEGAV